MRLSEAVQKWIAVRSVRWSPGRHVGACGCWKRSLRILGDRPLAVGDSSAIEALYVRSCEWRPATTNYYRSTVRGLFLWALRHGMISRDPTTDVWPLLPTDGEPVFRTVSRAAERILCRACPPEIARYIIVAIATGLRRSTLYRLIWEWVSSGWIDIPPRALKGRRRLRLPLNQRAAEALGPRQSPGQPLLPGLPYVRALNDKIRLAARRAGLDTRDLTTHQFRRTWVERFKEAGGTREECQLIQGWSSAGVLLNHYWPRVPEARARELIERI